MKTTVLDNVLSEKELFYMYNQIISSPCWRMNGSAEQHPGFMDAPNLSVFLNGSMEHYPFCMWGETVAFRIAKLLENKNIGMPTVLHRMWFNSTYHGRKTQHWLHRDDDKDLKLKSIVLFMTPIWQPDWRGSFYVDGEEFKYKPGSAVIFDAHEYHKGESPASETYNWQRISCNILVG